MKFKKGDIITGNRGNNHYGYTNERALMKVLSTPNQSHIKVEIIDSRNWNSLIKAKFVVKSNCFRKISKIERILKFDK